MCACGFDHSVGVLYLPSTNIIIFVFSLSFLPSLGRANEADANGTAASRPVKSATSATTFEPSYAAAISESIDATTVATDASIRGAKTTVFYYATEKSTIAGSKERASFGIKSASSSATAT